MTRNNPGRLTDAILLPYPESISFPASLAQGRQFLRVLSPPMFLGRRNISIFLFSVLLTISTHYKPFIQISKSLFFDLARLLPL